MLGPGNADRLAVVGSLPTDVTSTSATSTSRPGTTASTTRPRRSRTSSEINAPGPGRAGHPGCQRPVPVALRRRARSRQQHALRGRDDQLQRRRPVGLDGELLEFDPSTGQQVATITLPTITRQLLLLLSVRLQHRHDGTLLDRPAQQREHHPRRCAAATSSPATPTGGLLPESASIGTDGNVYFSRSTIGSVYQLNPTTGAVNFFALHRLAVWHPHQHRARRRRHLGRDFYQWWLRFDYSGNLQQQRRLLRDEPGPERLPPATSGRRTSTTRISSSSTSSATSSSPPSCPVPIGVTIWGVDNPNAPPQDTQDLLLVRPDRRPERDDRGQEPQRQERADHAGRRQRQRAGHRCGRIVERHRRRSRTSSPPPPAPTMSRSPATRACSTA